MAELPRYFANPELPKLQLPKQQDVWGPVFGHLAETFKRIDEGAVEAESRRKIAETQAKIEDAIKQGDANEVDPEGFRVNTEKSVNQIYKSVIESTADGRVRANLENALSPTLIKSATAINLTHKEKQVKKALGDSEIFMADQALLLGRTDDIGKRAEIEANVKNHLEAMRVTLSMSPKEVAQRGIKFLQDADRERASWGVINEPEKMEDRLKDPNYLPTLTGSERFSLQQRALEAMREKRVAAERAQKEIVDQARLGILVDMEVATNNGAALAAQREALIRRAKAGELPVGAVQWGIDRINHRINALQKGEADPFFHSDGAVLWHVTEGILNNPENWTKGDITRYMGQGLSVRDGKQLIGDLEKAHQGKPASEGMKQAFRFVEEYRKKGAFLSSTERTNFKTDITAQMKNDRLAAEVKDKIRARPNDNSVAVMNEVMQPYFDANVKTFWDTVRGGLEATGLVPPFLRRDEATAIVKEASREEQVAARQRLARMGEDVSEANIATAIQQNRKEKAGATGRQGASISGAAQTSQAPAKTGGKWEITDAGKIQRWYEVMFGRPLPVSAKGQTRTHDELGFDHTNGMDIAVRPESEEGQTIIRFLDSQNIPFIAFSGAVPGKATGPHIHVGPPSPKLSPTSKPIY
jgi:hypothetical protein